MILTHTHEISGLYLHEPIPSSACVVCWWWGARFLLTLAVSVVHVSTHYHVFSLSFLSFPSSQLDTVVLFLCVSYSFSFWPEMISHHVLRYLFVSVLAPLNYFPAPFPSRWPASLSYRAFLWLKISFFFLLFLNERHNFLGACLRDGVFLFSSVRFIESSGRKPK